MRSLVFLSLILQVLTLSAWSAAAQERGALLREITAKAEKLGFEVSTSDSLIYPPPFQQVKISNPKSQEGNGATVAKFDYILEGQWEWLLNVVSDNSRAAAGLIEGALLPKKATRAQGYFLKQLEVMMFDKKLFTLEVESKSGVVQRLRSLLSRQAGRSGERLAFFPPLQFQKPSLVGEGLEDQYWPLVVLEFPNYEGPITFQYSQVSVPLSQGRYSGDLIWINTRQLERLLSESGHTLEVEIRPASAQIFRSVEVPGLDKEAMEWEARSSYVSTFAGWFAPLWLALYPNARSLRIKKSLKSSLSVQVDIEPFRGMSCGPFLGQK